MTLSHIKGIPASASTRSISSRVRFGTRRWRGIMVGYASTSAPPRRASCTTLQGYLAKMAALYFLS
jgi:hypothetical protein